MRTLQADSLNEIFGAENTARLSAVYQDLIGTLAKGRGDPIPSRPTRLAIVSALLATAERGEFDQVRLKQAALSAVKASLQGEAPATLA